MTVELTRGAIRDMVEKPSGTVENAVIQVTALAKLQPSEAGKPHRYKLSISDGVHYCTGMLATQFNDLVDSGKINRYTVIRVNKYTASNTKGKTIIVFLALEVIDNTANTPIGNPISVESVLTTKDSPTRPAPGAGVNSTPTTASFPPKYEATPSPRGAPNHQTPPSALSQTPQKVTPIRELNMYNNRWTIRAVVESKGDIKKYTNNRGEGQLCNIEFSDDSGRIRATAWHEMADKIHNELEIGKVYYIKGGSCKQANKQYNNTGHPCEIDLKGATWTLCTDGDAPHIAYNFVPISEIENRQPKDTVDVIGVVKQAGNLVVITARSSGRQVPKRDLTMVDDSGKEIVLTLWGSAAEKYDSMDNPVILAKGAAVGDFGGRNLSARDGAIVYNPDIPEAHRLRGWYDGVGHTQASQSLSTTAGASSGETRWTDERLSLAVLKEKPPQDDKPIYFITSGYISVAKKENAYYKACPSEGCNKKVTETSGAYFCEKCNKEYSDFKVRMMLSMSIVDALGQGWVTAFHEQAEQILGISGADLHELATTNQDMYAAVFQRAQFTQALFKLRSKPETYQDEQRMRTTLTALKPLDYVSECRLLLNDINKMKNRQ